jgi:hypothetical protein
LIHQPQTISADLPARSAPKLDGKLWERDRQIRGRKKALGYLEAVAQATHAISDSTRKRCF